MDWFEVDRADVLAAKNLALTAAGAQATLTYSGRITQHISTAGAITTASTPCRGGIALENLKYQLRVQQRTCIEADLSQPGWVAAQKAAGWNSKVYR